jgi:hypothetical protein
MRNIGNSIKIMQKLRGLDIYCDSNRLGVNMFIRMKRNLKFQKGKPRWKVEDLYVQRQKAKNFVEVIFGLIICRTQLICGG